MSVSPTDPARNPGRDANDHRHLRHGRDRHDGFPISRSLQPPPMLFTRDGHNVFLGDLYRGASAFLVCAGPSLTGHDLTALEQRGVLTMAVNNAAAVVRPRLWTAVDDPGHFCDAVWYDPGVLKFVPLDHMEKAVWVRDGRDELVPGPHAVGDMPGVFGFRRNDHFRADQWLYEDTFNWGNRSDRVDADGLKGSRSVFYVALRLLFFLGVRTVYLLGCDFRMQAGRPNYAFEQDRSPGSVRGNNSTYRTLNARLGRLKPHFDAAGFRVFNCTPDSGLTVFPHLDYAEAVRHARGCVPERVVTAGMYDRAARAAKPPAAGSPLPLTLVATVTSDTLPALRWAWRTWERNRPWLRGVPVLVCHPRAFDPAGPDARWLRDSSLVRFQSCPDESPSADALARWAALGAAPQYADTPWVLFLTPTAVATPAAPGADPRWFAPAEGPAPVFVTGRAPPLPTELVARLNAWAEGVPGIGSLPPAGSAEVGGGVLFARTDWLRRLGPATTAPPEVTVASLLGYLAARGGVTGTRVRLDRHGWQVVRRVGRVARAAKTALAEGRL